MSEADEFVSWKSASPATQAERLTRQFYEWEKRGRGWQVWPNPVELEPPFRSFRFHHVPPVAAGTDDAQKPSRLGSFLEGLRARLTGVTPAPVPMIPPGEDETPEPEPSCADSALVSLKVSLPPTLKVTRDAAEQFLLSLSSSSWPLSFEVIGLSDTISVRLGCRQEDLAQLRQQLAGQFPDAALEEETDRLSEQWAAAGGEEAVIVDFGLAQEFTRPLRTFGHFDVDPLIGITAALAGVQDGEIGVFQVLFQATRNPWARSIERAVTDGEGGSFFADAPEMISLAREKVERPLFAAVLRVGAKSSSPDRAWALVRALGGALTQFSRPASNELIPLAADGYDRSEHEQDLLSRQTHRGGMLLNSLELVSLVHLPSASVRTGKLTRLVKKTRAAPTVSTGHDLVLGENTHAGRTTLVTLSSEHRVRHLHLVGASGTGKSHLLLNLIIQDLESGEGLAVFDPHGDLIDQVLDYVPERRAKDVVLFDPADEGYPVGFNILSAHSVLEKNLLASDLVAIFRRLSTSWGDQMTAILGNAVLAFLESEEGGTLAELRRFLVDREFRDAFLSTVTDAEVVYFWQKEFPLLSGRPQAPILTRLNAFLRHRLIRNMVCQRTSKLDISAIMNEGKILLAKLSQGAIGEENAALLGSLLVSKFHQLILARQELAQAERRPFWFYVDEFHNFATPSMATILSAARKYRLGLIMAHQDLQQLKRREPELASAVLTNPATRICFRVGDLDARALADGFSAFGAEDLQNLGVGEAICRIERANFDFNLKTLPLPSLDPQAALRRREHAIALSRETYASRREEVEESLEQRLAARLDLVRETPLEGLERAREAREGVGRSQGSASMPGPPVSREASRRRPSVTKAGRSRDAREGREVVPERARGPAQLGRGGPEHVYLQELVKRWAESREWHATIEKLVLDRAGRVDVALVRGDVSVACEISVSSSPEQELSNVRKCLAANFDYVVVVSTEGKTLRKARKHITSSLDDPDLAKVHFLSPEDLFVFLEAREAEAASTEETVLGYTVKTQFRAVSEEEQQVRRRAISRVIRKAVSRARRGGGESEA